jgi:hypothetical protein
MNRKIFATTLLCLSFCSTAFAQLSENNYNRMGLNFEYDGDYYGVGLSYHYMTTPYTGMGASIGCWEAVSSHGLLGDLYDSDYYNDYDDDRPTPAFYFEPSIILRSPEICGKVCFTAMPSVRFSTNYYSSSSVVEKGEWYDVPFKCSNISFGVAVGPSLIVGPVDISIGYKYSTLDTDRSYNPSTQRFTKHPLHQLFFEVSGYF